MKIRWISSLEQWLNSRKGVFLTLCSLLIFNTFIYLYTRHNSVPACQKREDAVGFSWYYAQKFLYFYYYTGSFPLASLQDTLPFSREAAYDQIRNHGNDLIMEYGHWSRLGESARIFVFLPNAWLRQSPAAPTVKLFNALFFLAALCVLFLGFRRAGKPLVGLLLVLLLQFTPFYLFEVYDNENIFALMACTFFLILGLQAPLLFSAEKRTGILMVKVIFSAILLGFACEIRNEIVVVFLSLLFIFLLAPKISFRQKGILVFVGLLFFTGTRFGIREYFDRLYTKTSQLVEENQGHVYSGGRIRGHNFWHPVFCGLGDFDHKYGYAWHDTVAFKYAIPVLQEKYGITVHYSGKYHTDDYYDSDSLYYKKFDEISAYESVIREKVLSDIKSDPFWYLTLLFKRILRTLSLTLPIPYVFWLILPLMIGMRKRITRQHLVLILISLPLSVTPLLIYSGRGATFNSVFPYMMIIVFADLLRNRTDIDKQKVETTPGSSQTTEWS